MQLVIRFGQHSPTWPAGLSPVTFGSTALLPLLHDPSCAFSRPCCLPTFNIFIYRRLKRVIERMFAIPSAVGKVRKKERKNDWKPFDSPPLRQLARSWKVFAGDYTWNLSETTRTKLISFVCTTEIQRWSGHCGHNLRCQARASYFILLGEKIMHRSHQIWIALMFYIHY